MLSYLEYVGLRSIFEGQIARMQDEYEMRKANSELKDQSLAYRNAQAAQAREREVYIQALQWSLEQVNKIKHEYA